MLQQNAMIYVSYVAFDKMIKDIASENYFIRNGIWLRRIVGRK